MYSYSMNKQQKGIPNTGSDWCVDCHDEYDDGYCYCGGDGLSYDKYGNVLDGDCSDCGRAINSKYKRCFVCNKKFQNNRKSTNTGTSVSGITGKWTKYEGQWCVMTPLDGPDLEGKSITVKTRAGKSETKTLGAFLTMNRWGDIYKLA